MRCQDIMKNNVQCLSPDDSVQTAARRMRDQNVGFLPICGADRKVLGVITDRDITCRLVADGQPIDTRVEQCMSTQGLAVVAPSDDLSRARELMCTQHVSRVLVCDEGNRLVGVISLSDIATHEEPVSAADTMRRVSAREARIH